MSFIILTINAGSSSLKVAAFEHVGGMLRLLAHENVEQRAAGVPGDFLARHGIGRVSRVAHRVVHGGDFQQPVLLDARVEAEIERLAPFAPLHNPFALDAIRACRSHLGTEVPQIAVFDTAFFVGLPDVARSYALPHEFAARHGLRRYGFHGIAHCSMWRQWLQAEHRSGGRVISLQLGAGCSMAAVKDGRALDTSMGFSPLEGLVMATRCGDIDAGLLIYLERELGLSNERLDEMLNRHSGLDGVSGATGDMRELLQSTDSRVRLAIDLYCYRARKYIGAYLTVLGGADAILFGGGVGENAWRIREQTLSGLEWAGISLDAGRNRAAVGAGTAQHISGPRAHPALGIAVWVIPVDEEAILAQETVSVQGVKNA